MSNLKWLRGAILLGAAFFLAIFIIKPIGVSTQFSVASGIVHSAIDKNVIQPDSSRASGYVSTNAYYDKSEGSLAKSIKNPLNYDFIFVLAIPFGALIGYLFDRMKKKKDTGENQGTINIAVEVEKPVAKVSFTKAYLPTFIGGFLLLFGARMADGCTSGHMMSGMMQGSVSGYILAASVFIIAIPTAMLVKKFNERQVG